MISVAVHFQRLFQQLLCSEVPHALSARLDG